MMRLFDGQELNMFFNSIKESLKEEIDSISDAEIMSCDFQEWIEYLFNKYSISPIIIFEENITQTIKEVKIKKYNRFYLSPYEKEYYEVDGVCISYFIPFDGDAELLKLRPSSYILSVFEVQSFLQPKHTECGSFSLGFEYTKRELEEQKEQMSEYVQKKFQNEFSSYKTMIQNINKEVNTFNNSIKNFADTCLIKRKEKADSFAEISKILEIPMHLSNIAPNTKPISLTKVTRIPPSRPNKKTLPTEYSIGDEHYSNINNIIAMCGTTMEKTARTYYHNNEEELRDHLLAALNTHYDNATGETFRKIGKTDIHIEFENKAAFIGECKIWHGEKLFQDAIQQIQNYATWKDTKVSVIIFNKENQSFQGVLTKIGNWIKLNTKSYAQPQANIWNCKYWRKDINIEISLNVSVFDLYVDKTQFQDTHCKNISN